MRFVHRGECLAHCNLLFETRYKILSVEAKAGQGKTVLARQFVEEFGRPCVWHSSRTADSDPFQFLESIVQGAKIHLHEEGVRDVLALLHEKGQPEEILRLAVERLGRAYALASGAPHLIVVDDAHELESSRPSLALLRDLALSMPEGVRFLVLSRYALQLQGQRLFQAGDCLRIDDGLLAFSRDEVSTLYNEVLGIPARVSDVARLHDATDGWVTGLLLLRGEEAANLPSLRSKDSESLTEFFPRHVLAGLSEQDAQDLMLLSLLDEMPLPLAESLASRPALERLNLLADKNFFTRRDMVDGQPVYRFHHLLQGFLRDEARRGCTPERRRQAQCAAGEWRLARQEAAQALEEFARAGDWGRVEDVLCVHGQSLLANNRHRTLLHVLEMAPPSAVEGSGWLCYFHGAARIPMGEGGAERYLRRAVTLFQAQGEERGELLVLGALLYFHLSYDTTFGKKHALTLRAKALFDAHAPGIDRVTTVHLAQSLSTTSLYYLADFASAARYLHLAYKLRQEQGMGRCIDLAVASLLAHGMRGDLQAATEELDELFLHVNDPDLLPLNRFFIHIMMANYVEMQGLERNYEEAKARLCALHKQELESTVLGHFLHVWDMDLLLARGRLRETLNMAERTIHLLGDASSTHMVSQFRHYRALSLAHLGRHEEALEETRRALRVRSHAGGRFFITLTLAMTGAALSLGPSERQSERMLSRAIAQSEAMGESYLRPTAYAYRAWLRLRQNRREEARADAEAMLDALRVHGNLHFFGLEPGLMSAVLGLAMDSPAHSRLAQHLAFKRFGLVLADDGAAFPILRVTLLGGTGMGFGEEGPFLSSQDFTPLQAQLVRLLAEVPDKALSVARIQQELWPNQPEEDCRAKFDTLLSRLRKSLADTFGQGTIARHLVVRGGLVALHHCVTDADAALANALDGLRLADQGRHWQAHCAFVRMAGALGAQPGQGFCRPGLALPDSLLPTLLEAAVRWTSLLKGARRYQEALDVAMQALTYDPINDRLQRTRYNMLATLRRPAEAAASLTEYRRHLEREQFNHLEIDEILESLLTE